MDYEKPSVPASWEEYARAWAEKLGLGDKEVRLICSPERYGAPVLLRLVGKGPKILFTRRSSDALDAAARRQRFIEAARSRNFDAIEIDMAGFFVEEALVAPRGSDNWTKWQPVVIEQLLRVAEPELVIEGEGETADEEEDTSRAQKVAQLRAAADAPTI